MYRSGEEDWTKHDTVAALVTDPKPTLWKFHWPESVHCIVHCNHKWSVCVQTNPTINFLLLLPIHTLHLGTPSSRVIMKFIKSIAGDQILNPHFVMWQ